MKLNGIVVVPKPEMAELFFHSLDDMSLVLRKPVFGVSDQV